MKYFILVALLLAGCASHQGSSTIFLREHSSRIYNLQGEECEESGYQFNKDDERLITTFKNCEVHLERNLQDYELPQWNVKK